MKMGMGTFWGILFFLIGLSLVIKVVFKIDFPLFKILFAFFLIYIGIKIITGNFKFFNFKAGKNDIIFSEGFFRSPFVDGQECNVVFGKGTLDLRNVDLTDLSTLRIKTNSVFSGTEILIDDQTPVKITTEGAFCGVHYPDGSNAAFGQSQYVSNPDSIGGKRIEINANVVFGGLQVKKY